MEGLFDHSILVLVSFSVFVELYYQRGLFNVISMKYNTVGKTLRFTNYLRKKEKVPRKHSFHAT